MTYRDRQKPWKSRHRFRKDAQREVKKRNFGQQYGSGLASLKRKWDMVEEKPELVLEEFTSWDQISPGDELMWCHNGVVHHENYHMEFVCVTSEQHVTLKYLTKHYHTEIGKIDSGFDSSIYPHKNPWSEDLIGWKRVVKEIPYDPNGQGETDNDI